MLCIWGPVTGILSYPKNVLGQKSFGIKFFILGQDTRIIRNIKYVLCSWRMVLTLSHLDIVCSICGTCDIMPCLLFIDLPKAMSSLILTIFSVYYRYSYTVNSITEVSFYNVWPLLLYAISACMQLNFQPPISNQCPALQCFYFSPRVISCS